MGAVRDTSMSELKFSKVWLYCSSRLSPHAEFCAKAMFVCPHAFLDRAKKNQCKSLFCNSSKIHDGIDPDYSS